MVCSGAGNKVAEAYACVDVDLVSIPGMASVVTNSDGVGAWAGGTFGMLGSGG
jgi:hypothetical protein